MNNMVGVNVPCIGTWDPLLLLECLWFGCESVEFGPGFCDKASSRPLSRIIVMLWPILLPDNGVHKNSGGSLGLRLPDFSPAENSIVLENMCVAMR